jgi:hypothetical protein
MRLKIYLDNMPADFDGIPDNYTAGLLLLTISFV